MKSIIRVQSMKFPFSKNFYSTLSPQKLLSSANIQQRIDLINDKYQHPLDKVFFNNFPCEAIEFLGLLDQLKPDFKN